MYMIENFGSWILDTRKGMVFFTLVTLLTLYILYKTLIGSVVVLTEKGYECTLPAPDGLGTKCLEYRARPKR